MCICVHVYVCSRVCVFMCMCLDFPQQIAHDGASPQYYNRTLGNVLHCQGSISEPTNIYCPTPKRGAQDGLEPLGITLQVNYL